LGRTSRNIDQYDAGLLFAIPRRDKRSEIGLGDALPFFGADLWTAFELSWLNLRGKPQIAIAQIVVPCESTHIVESKSLKLYLNSYQNTRLASVEEVRERIRRDLSLAVWHGSAVKASVGVKLVLPDLFDREPVQEMDGLSLDRLDIECHRYEPAPDLLSAAFDEQPVTETLVSNLLKSNCLVTGQPDWGTVQIRYSGPQIDQGGLLQYLVSFRNHHEFHEQCVERIFMDILTHCKPTRLSVYARYLRRGGIDINPLRASHPQALPPNVRTARQ
jgi:7-cyano-7-deazaguanine reductase